MVAWRAGSLALPLGLAVFACAAAPLAHAEGPAAGPPSPEALQVLRPGQRVRLEFAGGQLEGKLAFAREDSIQIAGHAPIATPLVSGIRVRRTHRAMIGFLIGAAAAFPVAVTYDSGESFSFLIYPIAMGAGAVAGSVWGYIWPGWVRLHPPPEPRGAPSGPIERKR